LLTFSIARRMSLALSLFSPAAFTVACNMRSNSLSGRSSRRLLSGLDFILGNFPRNVKNALSKVVRPSDVRMKNPASSDMEMRDYFFARRSPVRLTG